jgi:hypothetical protein
MERYENVKVGGANDSLVRWVAQMSLVEIHAVWERYAEERLVAAFNRDASHFIRAQEIKGIRHISKSLAHILVRENRDFFQFSNVEGLVAKGKKFLGQENNPFSKIPAEIRTYLNFLAKIRNHIVHESDYSKGRYTTAVKSDYGISAPSPGEFLSTIDRRSTSPAQGKSRLHAIALMTQRAISAV